MWKSIKRFFFGKRHKSKPTALRSLLFKCYRDAYLEANPLLRIHQSSPQAEQYIKQDFEKWIKENYKQVNKQAKQKSI